MGLISFALADKAKMWYNSLEPASIYSWDDFVEIFMRQYMPPSKMAKLAQGITNFRQKEEEGLYEVYQRWKDAERACPNPALTPWGMFQTFYMALNPITR